MSRETIALFDAQGNSIGAKDRVSAYRDGECVGLSFVWAAWRAPNGAIRTLLQTRSRPGDPYLGSLDAPAGGHIQAGESPSATAQREFAEEVGVQLNPDEVVFLGQSYLRDTQGENTRQAMQFFYLCTRPISLGETIFNEEVGAFIELGLRDFDDLVCGRTASIQGQAHYEAAPRETHLCEITPAVLDAYSAPIMDAIRRSVRAIRTYLNCGEIDPTIWTPPNDGYSA